MTLRDIASSIDGRFVPLGEHHGYVESPLTVPRDGSLLGAYLFQGDNGAVRITDDGDTLFRVAVAGAELNKFRVARYRAIAAEYGITLNDVGELVTGNNAGTLPAFFAAAHRIAIESLGHRPKTASRFTRIVGAALERTMPKRVTRRHAVVGASGHQLTFPFAVDATSDRATLIQPIPADNGKVDWAHVYQANGKFRDVMNSGIRVRRLAVIEPADEAQIAQARVALGDTADVLLYAGPESLAHALAD